MGNHINDWKKTESEEALLVQDKDESAAVIFAVVEGDDLEKALDELDKELEKVVTEGEITGQEQVKINEMDAVLSHGKGKIEGTDAKLALVLVVTPKGKVMMGLAMVEAAKEAAYSKTFEEIFTGIKPL